MNGWKVPAALVLVALIVLGVVLVKQGEREQAPINTAQEEQSDKSVLEKPFVVAIPTYPGFAIPYLAKEIGMFDSLNVELTRLDDAAAISSGMIRGDIDATFTSTDAFVLAASQGVDAVAVLMSDESKGADGIVVKPDITTVAGLKGKTVAANLGWPGHFFLLFNLKKAGIPFKDVPITNLDADKAGAAFVSGDLDAAVTWEPWLSRATSEGTGKILVSTATLPGVIMDIMIVRKETLEGRSQAVQEFVNGYYQALSAHNADKETTTPIMARALGLEAADFESMTTGFRFIERDEAASLLAADGAIAGLFREAANIWLTAEVIDAPVSDKGRVSNTYIESSSNR